MKTIIARTGSTVNVAVVTAENDRNPNDNTATSPVEAKKSTAVLRITKVPNKKSVKVGGKVTFTIKVKNVSKTRAVNVEVCDLIPDRLSVVYKDHGKLKSGNLCWQISSLAPGATRTYKPQFRVSNGRGSIVTNPARAGAYNARTVRAYGRIRVPARRSHGGGTTG
ncbi:MAG: hypothetical protein QM648_05130 [Solirubrobacterales bacterium]